MLKVRRKLAKLPPWINTSSKEYVRREMSPLYFKIHMASERNGGRRCADAVSQSDFNVIAEMPKRTYQALS